CHVVTTADAMIHASGHGYQEELKLMLNLVRPRYLLPIHGDHRRLHLHADLAEAVGIDPTRIFKGANGLPLEFDSRSPLAPLNIRVGSIPTASARSACKCSRLWSPWMGSR